MKNLFLLTLLFIATIGLTNAQKTSTMATSYSQAEYMREIPAISTMTDIKPASQHQAGQVRRSGQNKFVQGKGHPKNGDPLKHIQEEVTKINGKAPSVSFDAHIGLGLNDPTGAIGPNHYVYAFNSGFGIKDRTGATLMAEASLATLFPGEILGDPVVVYDKFADRFIIMEFSDTPNGYLVAVCQGPDPLNDGWFTYRFNTGTFPDYPKLSVWSDGYYVTANKDQGTANSSEVVWALERDSMLVGSINAQVIGFNLPGILTSGFYSPAGFNANGTELPPPGDAPIIYLQDDSWSGVSDDHMKVWNINVDWNTPGNSDISQPQIIPTVDFDSVFDGGAFANLSQPSGSDIDALQATIMYMAQYRRFANYNAVVFNFVVDLDGNDDHAGIRWMELRQFTDGDSWNIYQQGTYTQPDGLSAFCGGIAMDNIGNIGLAYTVVGETQAPSIRYTGRLTTDPLNTMTQMEDVIVNSNFPDPSTRYGDYAQMTIDPLDDQTFWHIAEYFGTANTRKSRVGAFKLATSFQFDTGVISIDSPQTSTLSSAESITVSIENFGTDAISDVPVRYQIDNGPWVLDTYFGTILPGEVVQFTFAQPADLSIVGNTYLIGAYTGLTNDQFFDNNGVEVNVTNSSQLITTVTLKALLQGPYNSSSQLMNDGLRANNHLPTTEPYSALGFNIVGTGGETTTNGVLSVTGPNAIVDWILVELRDGNNATQGIATQVGLIQRDGDIVSTDGVSSMTFDLPGVSSVYVVIRHRNHYGVRTNGAYLTSGLIDLDFTDPALATLALDDMVNINGINVIIGGDANQDGSINSVDNNNFWLIENGEVFDYSTFKADFNLDGVTNSVDKNNVWIFNNGTQSGLD